MGMRRNTPKPKPDLNDQQIIGADLPPLEFKGAREPYRKGRKRKSSGTDAQGRKRR